MGYQLRRPIASARAHAPVCAPTHSPKIPWQWHPCGARGSTREALFVSYFRVRATPVSDADAEGSPPRDTSMAFSPRLKPEYVARPSTPTFLTSSPRSASSNENRRARSAQRGRSRGPSGCRAVRSCSSRAWASGRFTLPAEQPLTNTKTSTPNTVQLKCVSFGKKTNADTVRSLANQRWNVPVDVMAPLTDAQPVHVLLTGLVLVNVIGLFSVASGEISGKSSSMASTASENAWLTSPTSVAALPVELLTKATTSPSSLYSPLEAHSSPSI
jgi:hypothetical protein